MMLEMYVKLKMDALVKEIKKVENSQYKPIQDQIQAIYKYYEYRCADYNASKAISLPLIQTAATFVTDFLSNRYLKPVAKSATYSILGKPLSSVVYQWFEPMKKIETPSFVKQGARYHLQKMISKLKQDETIDSSVWAKTLNSITQELLKKGAIDSEFAELTKSMIAIETVNIVQELDNKKASFEVSNETIDISRYSNDDKSKFKEQIQALKRKTKGIADNIHDTNESNIQKEGLNTEEKEIVRQVKSWQTKNASQRQKLENLQECCLAFQTIHMLGNITGVPVISKIGMVGAIGVQMAMNPTPFGIAFGIMNIAGLFINQEDPIYSQLSIIHEQLSLISKDLSTIKAQQKQLMKIVTIGFADMVQCITHEGDRTIKVLYKKLNELDQNSGNRFRLLSRQINSQIYAPLTTLSLRYHNSKMIRSEADLYKDLEEISFWANHHASSISLNGLIYAEKDNSNQTYVFSKEDIIDALSNEQNHELTGYVLGCLSSNSAVKHFITQPADSSVNPLVWILATKCFLEGIKQLSKKQKESQLPFLIDETKNITNNGNQYIQMLKMLSNNHLLRYILDEYYKSAITLDKHIASALHSINSNHPELADEFDTSANHTIKLNNCCIIHRSKAGWCNGEMPHGTFTAIKTKSPKEYNLPGIYRLVKKKNLGEITWKLGSTKFEKVGNDSFRRWTGKWYSAEWKGSSTYKFASTIQIKFNDTPNPIDLISYQWHAGYNMKTYCRDDSNRYSFGSGESLYDVISSIDYIYEPALLSFSYSYQGFTKHEENLKAASNKIKSVIGQERQDLGRQQNNKWQQNQDETFTKLVNELETNRLLLQYIFKILGIKSETLLPSRQDIMQKLPSVIFDNFANSDFNKNKGSPLIKPLVWCDIASNAGKSIIETIKNISEKGFNGLYVDDINELLIRLNLEHESLKSLKEYKQKIKQEETVRQLFNDESDDESYELKNYNNEILRPSIISRNSWSRSKNVDGSTKVLGHGAYNTTVYAGKYYDKDFKEHPVAIKTLPTLDKIGDTIQKLFFNEACNLQKVKQSPHPNVLHLYGISQHRNKKSSKASLSLVMEKAKTTLGSYLDELFREEKEISEITQVKLVLDIARGLSVLHNKDIVHKDIKDSNVLLFEDNIAKISDLGLSQIQEYSIMHSTQQRAQEGTFGWQAPEVIMGIPHNKQSDMFSFALLVWRIASQGSPLFSSDNSLNSLPASPMVLMRKYMNNPEFRLKIPEGCPQILSTIIKKCWAANNITINSNSRMKSENVVQLIEDEYPELANNNINSRKSSCSN